MTSWSTSDLKMLKEITNHRVVFDGYEFVWESNTTKGWNRHYIRNFKDYNKPMSWIYFNISLWENEYKDRLKDYTKNMIKGLDADVKIKEICLDHSKKTKQKIHQIKVLKPEITSKEIADILNITQRSVQRHLS